MSNSTKKKCVTPFLSVRVEPLHEGEVLEVAEVDVLQVGAGRQAALGQADGAAVGDAEGRGLGGDAAGAERQVLDSKK